MYQSLYESHIHEDPNFPIIFHLDTLDLEHNDFMVHWHENVELLYFIEGRATVSSDMLQLTAKAGDLVIINSNNLHAIHAAAPQCRYYCLIVDKSFCDSFDIFVSDMTFKELIRDSMLNEYFDIIIREMQDCRPHYKTAVKSTLLSLLIHLCRYYTADETTLSHSTRNKKLNVVKATISFIRKHYKAELSINEICVNIGFSKYYCCHTFKEVTGRTLVDYINFLRCSNARKLLSSGKYNVSESAALSGFNNLSYFSKIYKKHMGISPSQENEAADRF